MPPAKLSASLALVGGVLWVAHALLGGGSDPVPSTLHFVGLACLLVASCVFGTTLVRSGGAAMRVVTGLAFAVVTLALIESFRPFDAPWYIGGWGVLAAAIGATSLLRGTDRTPAR